MGATFPFMMAFVREENPGNADSFSLLYVANVLGAMSGSFFCAIVLVELGIAGVSGGVGIETLTVPL